MGISDSLPMTGYIKMIDIWMIFTISYPFTVITLHCLKEVVEDRGNRRINVETTGRNTSIDKIRFTNFVYFKVKANLL